MEGKAVGLLQYHHVGNGLVHHLGSLAAESGDYQRLGNTQSLPGLLLGGKEEFLAHGHSHHLHLLRVLVVLHTFLEGHQHPGSPAGSHFGGYTGNGIALVDTGGDFHTLGGIQRRKAGVAAGADHRVGLKVPENPFAFANGTQHTLYGMKVLLQSRGVQLPAQAGAGQTPNLVPRLGH